MTESEEKRLRFLIARLESTLLRNVCIERTETVSGKCCNVYAKVKGYRVGVLTDGARILQSWRVV